LLPCQAGGLELVEVLRELMQILRRELGQLLVDLFAGEAAGLQGPGHFVVTEDVAHDGDVGGPLIEALVRRRLRGDRSGEGRHGRKGGHQNENDEDGVHRTLRHLKNLLYSPALPADRARGAPATAIRLASRATKVPDAGKLLRRASCYIAMIRFEQILEKVESYNPDFH